MIRPQALNRFFVSSDYSIYYRRTSQFEWLNQVTGNYLLLAVLAGQIDCLIDRKRTQLNPSQSVIVEPNVAVAAIGRNVEFLCLSFASSLVIEQAVAMRLLAEQSTVIFTPPTIEKNRQLDALYANLVSELLDERPGQEIVLRALSDQILVHLLRYHSSARRSDQLELSRIGLVDRRIRKSVELMHAQLDQELSLKSIAAASYLSPFHFLRLFKKLTGTTPHNYLAAIRASRAQSLLAGTDMSITEVGARVGYLSASHFSKAFRQATGTTPREFRKALISR